MKKEIHQNRYGDTFTFTPTEDGNVLWEGKFEWCRFSYPNDYTNAYRAYTTNGGLMNLEEFIEEVHRSIYGTNGEYISPSDISRVYGPLVGSKKNIINMVDPSGGPYLAEGMPSTMAYSEIEGKCISHFERIENGFKIILI